MKALVILILNYWSNHNLFCVIEIVFIFPPTWITCSKSSKNIDFICKSFEHCKSCQFLLILILESTQSVLYSFLSTSRILAQLTHDKGSYDGTFHQENSIHLARLCLFSLSVYKFCCNKDQFKCLKLMKISAFIIYISFCYFCIF